MTMCFRLLLLAGCASLWSLSALPAGNLLVNGGFEQPPLSPGNTWYAGISGWTIGGGAGAGTIWAGPQNSPTPCPEGNQYVWGSANQFYLEQIPLAIQSNTLYTFVIDLYRMSPQGAGNSISFGLVDGTTGGYLAVTEYQPTYLPSKKDFDFLTDQWTRVSVTYNSATDPSRVGHLLKATVNSYLCALDNVTLTTGTYMRAFYISTAGSDLNDGLSPATPWRSFTNVNARTLLPSESVLLRRGDEWRQELHLRGKGAPGQYITLADYGLAALDRPRIRRYDVEYDRCAVVEGASYWRIHGLDLRDAKIGLYLRYYQDYVNTDVAVYDCHVEGLTDQTLDPPKHDYELAWSVGIFIGGRTGGPVGHPLNWSNVLNGVSVSNCTFRRCAIAFGNAWYYPEPYKGRLRNVRMSDCTAIDCMNGALMLFDTDGAVVERVRAIGGGGDCWCGSALAIVQASRNIVIDNCEFAWINRAHSGDGVGFDFEGSAENCVFRNVVIHDCSGAALLNLTTGGINSNMTFANCTFYNNARNPWNDQIGSEMCCGYAGNLGIVSNCGLYTSWNADGAFSANWGGHAMINVRTGSFRFAYNRPTWWGWQADGNFDGWISPNQLDGLVVSGGALRATSSGTDPFIVSAPTWTPALATRFAWVRMSQTAGTHAQFFWITETDPNWDSVKSAAFPINADGAPHDYYVDLIAAGAKGLITQLRLDPTIVAGSAMAIDYVRLVESINPPPTNAPAPRPAWPIQTTLTGQTLDNWMLESSSNSQAGGSIGTVSATTLRAGDESNNAAYRTIVSFDTSPLPDNANILEATLAVRRSSVVGDNPWIPSGSLVDGDYCEIDQAVPYFGAASAVVAGDWEVTANLTNVGRYIIAYQNGLQVREQLGAAARALINPGAGGAAQFRLRFTRATNGDNGADYVNFGSANHGTVAYRPILKCAYYTSAPPALVSAPFTAPAVGTVTMPATPMPAVAMPMTAPQPANRYMQADNTCLRPSTAADRAP